MSDLRFITTDALLAELTSRSDAINVSMIPKAMRPTDGPRAYTHVTNRIAGLVLVGTMVSQITEITLRLNKSAKDVPFDPGAPTETDE